MNKSEIKKLKELRKLLSMEPSQFSDHQGKDIITLFTDSFLPCKDAEIMPAAEFVRRHTRLWRESWVFPPLDQLIKKYDK